MESWLHFILDSFRTAVLISGLVVIMMMLIELVNINSHGGFFCKLQKTRLGQTLISAVLGIIPGCMGGFASVSLYTHGIISFGALVAMMIASSGDEAFVMLSMFPGDSVWIFALLFVIAVITGLLTDLVFKTKTAACCKNLNLHSEDEHKQEGKHTRSLSFKRVIMFIGVSVFITALLAGWLECCHHEVPCEGEAVMVEHDGCACHGGVQTGHENNGGLILNLLSEEWMYWLFSILSLSVLAVLIFGSDHFIDEHLWHHIVKRHLPAVFLWTFGALLALSIGLHFFDIEAWVKESGSHTFLLIILAAAIGLIPESGPHLIFVTLFAGGIIPFPVLLSSCISQDGHASLPLFAESKSSFVKAKAINMFIAILAGSIAMLF